jgi:hypothetical protein
LEKDALKLLLAESADEAESPVTSLSGPLQERGGWADTI